MSNTKAELVAAAVEDGFGTEEDLTGMTKARLLELWEEI
jgi:hypothetical protein